MKEYLAAIVLAIGVLTAGAAEQLTKPATLKTEGRIFATIEQFRWKEYFAGDELVKESGPLFGIGVETTTHVSQTLDFDGRGRLFYGEVDYDGAIIDLEDGTETPAKSETKYSGLELEGSLARSYPTARGITWRPFAGLNMRYWLRELDNSEGAGYDEYWLTLAARLGLEVRVKNFYARAALRAPLYNNERVDLSENGGPDDLELEPGKELSFDGEVGVNIDRYFAALYVETLEFSESDSVNESGFEIFQPESKARFVGLRGGFIF